MLPLLLEGMLLSLVRLDHAFAEKVHLPVFPALLRRRDELSAARRTAMASRRIPGATCFAIIGPLPHMLRMLLWHGSLRVRL